MINALSNRPADAGHPSDPSRRSRNDDARAPPPENKVVRLRPPPSEVDWLTKVLAQNAARQRQQSGEGLHGQNSPHAEVNGDDDENPEVLILWLVVSIILIAVAIVWFVCDG